MKYIRYIVFIILGLFILTTSVVEAKEGRFSLTGSASCEGISIWDSSRYQISGRCENLAYPYSEQLDTYILWVRLDDGSEIKRIDTIDRGIIDGSFNTRYNSLFITAEEQSSPKTPSSFEIARGSIESFNFSEPIVLEKQTPAPGETIKPSPSPKLNFSAISKTPLILLTLVFIVLGVILFRSRK